MQPTAHHAIKTRLTMWQLFFASGADTTPAGATDGEYGLDTLLELARVGDGAELHELAAKVERMERGYMLKLDDQHAGELLARERYAAAMMQDDPSPMPEVTIADLDAALSGL